MSLLDSQLAWGITAFVVTFVCVPAFVLWRDRRAMVRARRQREQDRERARHMALVDHVRRGEPAVLFDDADLEFDNVIQIRRNVVRLDDHRKGAA